MTKLCYIGHFGGNESFREGQTIKTQNVDEVLKNAHDIRVKYVDTYYYNRNVLKFAFQLLGGLLTCKKVVLCVSKSGRRVFFPILYWFAKILKKKIYHIAIGGRLAEEIEDKPKWKRYIQSFCVNWVESQLVVDGLNKVGVTNGEYLPNFKKLPVLNGEEFSTPQKNTTSFCMFSRITGEKGVTEAIEAVAQINQKYGRIAAILDLFGPVAPDYEDTLKILLTEHNAYVRYCGEVEPEASVEALRHYEVLLFPTRRFREGIPGTIIDALCSGVPVIARQWKYCHEMLTHGYNGYYYDYDQPDQLAYWMEYAVEHPAEIFAMRKNCLLSADQYRTENVAPVILQKLAE